VARKAARHPKAGKLSSVSFFLKSERFNNNICSFKTCFAKTKAFGDLMRVVYCTAANGLRVPSNSSICAERRLLELFRHMAERRGVPRHRVVVWIRRQAGILSVERLTRTGEPACSLPCILCRCALDAMQLRWEAVDWAGEIVTDQTAPAPVFTHRQKNCIFVKS
jgi:hypothetical protein